jgi:hypothetical protein
MRVANQYRTRNTTSTPNIPEDSVPAYGCVTTFIRKI